MSTHHNFIGDRLNKIEVAVEKGILDYVETSTTIHTAFGRTYLRWYVNIELKGFNHFTYAGSDFQSYPLLGRDRSSYRLLKDCNGSIFDVENKHHRAELDECDSDISKFITVLKLKFPNVKLYNLIRHIEFVKWDNTYDIHSSTLKCVEYVGVKNDKYSENCYLNPTKPEDVEEEHHFILETLKDIENENKILDEIKERAEIYINPF